MKSQAYNKDPVRAYTIVWALFTALYNLCRHECMSCYYRVELMESIEH